MHSDVVIVTQSLHLPPDVAICIFAPAFKQPIDNGLKI